MDMDRNTNAFEQEPPRSAEALFLHKMFSSDGWGTKLMTPIAKVGIVPETVAAAFRTYLNQVGVGETFTLTELLTTPEFLLYRSEVIGKPGDGIYLLTGAVSDPHLRRSLLQNSVPGLCALLLASGGAELRVPAEMTLEKMATERFLLLRERDGDRLCSSDAVKMVRVGTVRPDVLRVSNAVGGAAEFTLSSLLSAAPVELTVGNAAAEVFEQGFSAALTYGCCCLLPGGYFVNLAADLPLAELLAGALGIFGAAVKYRFGLPPMRYQPNGKTGLVVPRPTVFSGDVIYAFRPKCGTDNRPLPVELAKLQRFLTDAVHDGKIKSVLPLKKNALEMMTKLGGEELVYCAERDFPTDCFAVLAVLSAGADVPGTRLGKFQTR